jgi:hypothetical protein
VGEGEGQREGATEAPAKPSDAAAEAQRRIDAMQRGAQEQPTDLTALEKTHKVLSVGGVINAVDKAHFDEKLKELLEVVDRYDLNVGFIWAIGSVQNIMNSPNALFLVARQGVIEAAEEAPDHYNIKRSPTWVLRTPKGEILLEATGPLAAHFNMKGEFVEKPNEMRVAREEDVPQPSPGAATEGENTKPTPTPSPTPDPLFGGVQPKL